MLKTHKNFKSLDSNFNNAETIDNYLGKAIYHQNYLSKRTTPWEMHLWQENELENFEIDLEKVDRLYYVYYSHDSVNGDNCVFVCRMNDKNKYIYIEMAVGCDFSGYEDTGRGVIFISMDANLFLKSIISNKYPMEKICQSLIDDGIQLESNTKNVIVNGYEKYFDMIISQTPPFENLRHLCPNELKNVLLANLNSLPDVLKYNLNDFINFIEIKYQYDDLK